MIYDSSLCKKRNCNYLYFEIKPEDIKMFKFDEHTEGQIIQRNEFFERHKLSFMVYNGRFIAGYYALVENRCKFFLHMMFNASILFITQYFIYYPMLCLSLIHPYDSISNCTWQE